MELWKEVVGDPRYEVSSFGNLRTKEGELLTTCMKRVMSQNGKDYRYKETNRNFINQANKKTRPYVHHIVASAFLGWTGTGIVRFKNGDTSDCSVDNLFITDRTTMLQKNKQDRIDKCRESYLKKGDYPRIGFDKGYYRIRIQIDGKKYEVRNKDENLMKVLAEAIRLNGKDKESIIRLLEATKDAK